MNRILLLNFLFSILALPILAQCPVTATATATPDVICSPGGTVNLSGTNTATTLFEEFWTASVGSVSSPNAANTTANISVPTTFTYTARACDNNNLIVNGDFESGNTGFTSWFNFSTSFFPTPGEYYVTDDPSLFGFPNCVDKTTGSGVNMQLIDALGIDNENAWCQTVSVNPTSDYKFTFWGLALVLGTTLEASINGTPIGATVIPSPLLGVCDWRKVEQTWVNPGVSSAQICITNTTSSIFSLFPPSVASPVYAIDEITFVELCTDSDDVFVDVILTEANIAKPTPSIDCSGNSVTLDGSASSSGSNITYQWTTSGGNIVGSTTNNTADVDEAGDYTLTVTYDDGTTVCSDAETVTVDNPSVMAVIIAPPSVDCSGNDITLDGTTSTGNITSYQWTTTGGTLPTNTSTPSIDVNQPGDYTLTVMNNSVSPPCSHSQTVTITAAGVNAMVIGPLVIDCDGNDITLDGSTSTGNISSYQWTTNGGVLPSITNTPSIDINEPGDYTLTVFDNSVSPPCEDFETVTIISSEVEAIIIDPPSVDCDGTPINIDGSGSTTGSNITYSWSTPDGNIIGSTSGNSIVVDEGGEYILTVTYNDGSNICTDTESVVVNEIEIEALVASPDLIDCDNNPITLDGTNSSSGTNISYAWTTPDGNIIGSFSGNTASVDEAGDYTLTVTYDDGTTNCSVFETVTVTEVEVEANIITPNLIDCDNNPITIDGSTSTTGPDITYSWSTPDGNILGATSGNTIDVDMEGEYILTVTYNDGNIICSDVESVFVNEIEIDIIIDTPPVIDCNGTPVLIDGSSSTAGTNIFYSWTTPDGNILGSTTGNTIDVDMEGEYFLTLTYNDGVTICSETESITVTQIMISVDVEIPDLIDCDNNPITLDASNSSAGTNIFYEWTTSNGNIIGSSTGNMIEVDKEGDYTFTLTYDDGTTICKESETVSVEEIEVEAIIDTPPLIDCDNTPVILDGFGSSTGTGYTYEWTSTDGNIVGSNTNINVEVNQSGEYTLTVRYDANGIFCETSETITVEEIEIEAVIVPPPLIDCDGNSIFIDGNGSSVGAGYFYEWTTITGNILGSNSDIDVQVNEPGEYTLTVTYDNNGVYCEASISVIVEQVQIDVQIETPDLLDCQNTPIIINGSNSSGGSEYSYEWTTSVGNIIGAIDQSTVEVNVAADYFLTVTYDANGIFCSKTESINVQNSTVSAVIADPDLIDCDGNPVILDGSGSSQGPGIVLKWTTIDGNIIGPDFFRTIEVDEPGEYILEVSFNDNGVICTQSTSVMVEKIEVEIDIVTPPAIDCFGNAVFIDGSNSSNGPNYFYEWTTPDGNIVGVNNEPIVEVDKEGDYTLNITYDDGVNFCTNSETVTIEKIEVEVIIETPDLIDCEGNPINLDGSNSSSGVGYFYEWTTSNGNILSPLNTEEIEANRAGIYFLTVTYDLNGITCSKMESIEVFNDPNRPTANILPPIELNCKDSILTLNGSQSTQGSNIVYEWSSDNGNITSSLSSDSAIINQIGTYQLLVTNTDNACQDSVEVNVIGNYNQPIISLISPDTLNCRDTVISINASNSGSSANFNFDWNTITGNIISNTNLPIIEVSKAGFYELILTQNSNGCKDTVAIEVPINTLLPKVNILMPDPINCTNDSIRLDGTGSDMGSDYSVSWETVDGNFLTNQNTPTPYVDKSGTYWFTVENIRNGCADSLSIFVEIDTIAPIVDGGLPLTFGCASDSVQLMPTVSGNTSNFLYQWGAVTGNILSNSFVLNPFVGSAGTYMIFVRDTSNNCMSVDTAKVLPDVDLPSVGIVAFDTLGCSVDSIQLDATSSDIGSNFNFSWTTIDGNFNSNPTDYQPFVTEPGTYELVIENTDNGCENLATITIVENIDTPQIFIPDPEIINCERTQVDIISFASSQTGNISFEWSTPNGSIIGAADGPTMEANSGGNYFLKVTDLDRGCESVKEIEIIENTNTPDFQINSPDTLNCRNSSVVLQPSILNSSTNYIYEWTSTNGGFIGAANEENAIADLIGNYTLLVIDTVSKCKHLETTQVFENIEYPLVSIETQDSLDCGENRIIDASNSSQGNDFIYRWTTPNGVITSGNNTLMPTISSEGKYILEIENSVNGCISIDSVELLGENSISNIEIILNGIDTLDCLNSSITATANQGNYSYRWINAINPTTGMWTNEALIETPGIVQVILKDLDTGCEGSTTIEVFGDFEKPMVTPLLPDSITCQDTLVELAVQVNGNSNDYLFSWTTTDGNFSQNNNQNTAEVTTRGLYTIETTSLSNGCKDTSVVEVFESKDVPQIEESVSNEINCKFDSAVISTIVSNIGTNADFTWTTVDGRILSVFDPTIVTIGAGGTYKIEVVDFNTGCSTEKEIIVTENFEQPIINSVKTDTLTCIQLEVEAIAEVTNSIPTEFEWSTNNGNILGATDNATIKVDEPGVYNYKIVNLESFCELSGDIEVIQDITPPEIVIATPEPLTCETNQIQIDARQSSNGGFLSNRWTTNSNGNIVSGANGLGPIVDKSAMYYLEITNIFNGCNAVDSVKVDSLPDDLGELIISEVPPSCDNELGTIQIEDISGSFPPFEYSIDGGLNFSDDVLFENLPEGNYDIIVRDSIGCTEFEMIEFIVPSPVELTLIPEITLAVGATQQLELEVDIPLDQIESIEWIPTTNLSCSDCLNPIVTGTNNTSYLARITTIDDCAAEATIQIKVTGTPPQQEEGFIYFPSAFSPNDDGINDLFTGFSTSNKVVKIETLQVYDRWGNKMYEGNNGSPNSIDFGWDGRYKNKRMNSGVYVFYAKVELVSGEMILVEGDITLHL